MSTPSQVQELIDSSGNTFHAKVTRWFASNGWSTIVSPYYMDQSQQKARELDIIVEKVWSIKGNYDEWFGEVAVRLFVECKFLLGYSAFWFADKDRSAIVEMLCASGKFRGRNDHISKHHYLSSGNRVAKLFASSNARGQESEPFYKALNQALNGLVSMRMQLPRAFSSDRRRGGFHVVLDFPVVVCSSFSQLYAADFVGTQETSLIRDNFQLEVQYAYVEASGKSRDELFLLDIVEYEQLPQFSNAIDEDAHVAGFFARRD
ncbi:MAG: hypothetical protein NDI90_10585 [Nitrospira sp. BO4]|jgi:hypothetical protein|nr:hypothetical protein [Nitrospira sp. BO4]